MMILKKPQGAETKQTLAPNTVLHKHTTKDVSWELSRDRKNELYSRDFGFSGKVQGVCPSNCLKKRA